MKYDNFPAFQKIEDAVTNFTASRYEIWMKGEMIEGNQCQVQINFSPTSKNNEQSSNAVTLNWSQGQAGIVNRFLLDIGFSQNNRLTYATIPNIASNDCVGIITMRSVLGVTDYTANISGNTPYCGNLFLKFGVLAKVTFAFSNPEKLIEFYTDEAEGQIFSAVTAKCVLELLIEDHDSDGAYAGFDAIKAKVLEDFDIKISDNHFKQAEGMLNSGVGGYRNMVSVGYTHMFLPFFKSNYGKGPMRSVLNVLDNELK